MSKKMVMCKTCGAEIAKSAKICPHCGAKKKGSVLLPILGAFVIFCAIGAMGGGSEEPAPEKEVQAAAPEQVEQIEYTAYTVDQMVDMLEDNALKAEQTYDDQYVEITGELSVIDSDGRYIGLYPEKNPYSLLCVQCYLQNDAQVEQVMEMTKGDSVTVRGQITAVGEIMGYQLEIDEIV